jgi:phosphatidate cytidylyltransferase
LARAEPGDFYLRLASALVLAPLALAAIWIGGAVFAALVTVAALLLGWEWARLARCRQAAATAIALAAALACVALALGAALGAVVIVAAGAALAFLLDRGVPGALWAALGSVVIALPCLACLSFAGEAGRLGLLWLFLTVWATDTGALLLGRAVGGPRLAPMLSPNKTWAGLAGGLIAAAIMGWAVMRVAGASASLVVASLGASIAAQLGDLAESATKRRFGVKDSGHLIPGHGGLLDRLDGMLAASVLAWLMALTAPFLWRAS